MPDAVGIVREMTAQDSPFPTPRPARVSAERRSRDRRLRIWWSLIYGSFNPRRRDLRRAREVGFQSLDWHAAHLLAVAIGIVLLSAADALMTVTLMAAGADEVNPFMATFAYDNTYAFAAVKMSLTGVGVIVLVALARYRFMRCVRVDVLMYCLLVAYAGLLIYERGMLRELTGRLAW